MSFERMARRWREEQQGKATSADQIEPAKKSEPKPLHVEELRSREIRISQMMLDCRTDQERQRLSIALDKVRIERLRAEGVI